MLASSKINENGNNVIEPLRPIKQTSNEQFSVARSLAEHFAERILLNTIEFGLSEAVRLVNKAGALIATIILFSLADSIAATRVLSQAGSIGGAISKQNKSVSGDGEGISVARPSRKDRFGSVSTELDRGRRKPNSRCPNISGLWNSWASGIWGKADTNFSADGTASHRSGFAGKWFCENGQLRIEWSDGAPGAVKLSPDQKRIIGSGGVHMSRD